jgi:hypothetical protein
LGGQTLDASGFSANYQVTREILCSVDDRFLTLISLIILITLIRFFFEKIFLISEISERVARICVISV